MNGVRHILQMRIPHHLVILHQYGQMWQEVLRKVEFTGLEHNLPRFIHHHCCLVLLLVKLRKKWKQCEDKFQSLQNDFNHLNLTLLKCRNSWRNIWLNLMKVKGPTLMKSRLFYSCLDIFYEI
ncbi:hypothetical protein MTR67_003252 [Solanum verrucosum]|uniref:Uncharacterized protein n=1 Tax=Solanum verrucosum TaxID=315347 RepID=A0AAF0PS57_SOLVR|nr:hypothetical protein MTR67_003252 [Solanum verrucosum]